MSNNEKGLGAALQGHTPGPWGLDFRLHIIHVCGDERSLPIAVLDGEDMEAKANARLIRAAPEMLKALRAVAGVYEGFEDAPLFVLKVRAAIAKATRPDDD